MNTGKRTPERTPQVREQVEVLGATIVRLGEVVSQLTTKLQPVLAEVGGEKATTDDAICRGPLAPLAEDVATLDDRIMGEIQRLQTLVHRCEV